jgi:hypothetical protein
MDGPVDADQLFGRVDVREPTDAVERDKMTCVQDTASRLHERHL